jgi:hypothetical protein
VMVMVLVMMVVMMKRVCVCDYALVAWEEC